MRENQPFLSVADLAARWNVHPNTIRRGIENGDFPEPVRIGKQFRFYPEDIETFEREQRGRAA